MQSLLSLRPRRVLVILALPTLGACLGGMGRAENPFTGGGGESGRGEVSIEVQNLNFNDATLYAIRNGQQTRIGRVTGKSDGRFRLEWSFALPLQVAVDLVGGRGCRTAPLQVDPGDRLSVRIPSTIGVTRCLLNKR